MSQSEVQKAFNELKEFAALAGHTLKSIIGSTVMMTIENNIVVLTQVQCVAYGSNTGLALTLSPEDKKTISIGAYKGGQSFDCIVTEDNDPLNCHLTFL